LVAPPPPAAESLPRTPSPDAALPDEPKGAESALPPLPGEVAGAPGVDALGALDAGEVDAGPLRLRLLPAFAPAPPVTPPPLAEAPLTGPALRPAAAPLPATAGRPGATALPLPESPPPPRPASGQSRKDCSDTSMTKATTAMPINAVPDTAPAM
jgi:hypothetical protein